jgi:predicted hotdog family 3-hydroxylacyl-ACP dehydratase
VQAELMAVQFGAHPARMGRQQQDAVAHHQGFLDGMRDEHEGKTQFFPQAAQLLLHLAPRQGIEGGKGLVHQQHFGGCMARARAMATRCFMPPDKVCGWASAKPARPTLAIQ